MSLPLMKASFSLFMVGATSSGIVTWAVSGVVVEPVEPVLRRPKYRPKPIPASARMITTNRITTVDCRISSPDVGVLLLKRALTVLIVFALGISIAQIALLAGSAGEAQALLPSFARGLVSTTFDDSWEGQYTYGLPSMIAHNVKGTMFTTTSFIDSDPARLTTAQLQAFKAGGHEIGSHQVDHVDPVTLTPAELTYQLTASKAWLEARFGPIYDYASPFGTYDATTIAAIQKYYLSQRTVDDGFNSIPNFDQYTLKVKHLFNTVTPADVAGWLAQAKADKTSVSYTHLT